jgi:hypothetical protein
LGSLYTYMEMSQWNALYNYHILKKNVLKRNKGNNMESKCTTSKKASLGWWKGMLYLSKVYPTVLNEKIYCK